MRCRGVWVHVGGNGMNLTFFGLGGACESMEIVHFLAEPSWKQNCSKMSLGYNSSSFFSFLSF